MTKANRCSSHHQAQHTLFVAYASKKNAFLPQSVQFLHEIKVAIINLTRSVNISSIQLRFDVLLNALKIQQYEVDFEIMQHSRTRAAMHTYNTTMDHSYKTHTNSSMITRMCMNG